MSNRGYVRAEDVDERTVTWTGSPRTVEQVLSRIASERNSVGHQRPKRRRCSVGGWAESETAWRDRCDQALRQGPVDAVVRAMDLPAISWSPSVPRMCERVLQWAHAALTRLQSAYDEIDFLKKQWRAQAKTIGDLREKLAGVRAELAEEKAARAAEVKACHRMIDDLSEQLAVEKQRALRLGGDLAAERRVTAGLQTALSTTLLTTTLHARAAGVSELDQQREL